MFSPFARLFLAIQQRIAQQVPAITHIAQDTGQLSVKSRPPLSWPCALIDFDEFTFNDLAQNVQLAKGIVIIRLGFAPHSPTGLDTPPDFREAALSYYDIEWALHRALHGWSPDGDEYGHLTRATASTQCRHDSYRVRELSYTISFDDYSTKPGTHFAPADLVIHQQLGL